MFAALLRYDILYLRGWCLGVASFDEEAHEFALKEMEKTLGCRIL